MKFDSVTIKDIAKALNLSTSSVSRALRGSHEISAETKKLVLEYAEKMGYRPNPIALSLKERRSRSIGVVVGEIANNFFSQTINGIESIAYNRGYHVIIAQTHESQEREKVNVQHLASRAVDGLLLSVSYQSEHIPYLQELHDKGMPLVFFDRVPDSIHTHKVTANNFQGAFDATSHLLAQGFRRIAHITSSPHSSISRERLAGYRAALEQHNIAFDQRLVHYCHHGGMIADEVEAVLRQLAALKQGPDAIFTLTDRLTIECFGLLKQMQPAWKGVGFTGFSNTNTGDLFSPSLTVVRQPAFDMGQTATEMLLGLIESKRPVTDFENRVLNTELVVRASSQKGGVQEKTV